MLANGFLPITRTKIILPRRRPELLARPRLLSLLDELLDYRLVIIAAPAGYGKTSLLVDFAHSTQYPVCWYSLDNLDQDPQRFIAHFISAIAQRFPQFGKNSMAALQGMGQDRLDPDVLASLIINDAYENITEHFVLVLDDFHLVEDSQPVVNFVNRFIQDVDENCHLVMTSRSLLNLPDMTLLVARSQVGGLSFDELCFLPDEIQGLLKQTYHIDITEEEATELARDTEGWVTGLMLSTQLMGKTIANRQRVERASGVGLYEYLAKQVLERQDPEVQDFLMRSALLEEFDAQICESVIGKALNIQPNWRNLMKAVFDLNLFVLPIGEDGAFLRYHHLFRDFLRNRIQRDRPDEARLILLRLAEVYIEREDWERAYAVYQSIGDVQAIIQLLENAGSTMITRGRLVTLSEWLAALPANVLEQHPILISLQGTIATTRGEIEEGLRLLDDAIVGLRRNNDRNGLAYTLNRRSVAFIMASRYSEAFADTTEELELIPSDQHNSSVYAHCLFARGITLTYQGKLDEAQIMFEDALGVYQGIKDENSIVRVLIEMGRVSKMLGDYPKAEAEYKRALGIIQLTNDLLLQANLYNSLGVMQHVQGDYVTAISSFEKAAHYAKLSGYPRLEAYVMASIGDLYQELDATQEAFEAYRQSRDIAQHVHEDYLAFYLNLAESRLALTLDDISRAQELLVSAQAITEKRGLLYEQNQCRLEWGRLKLLQGEYHEALVDLNSALDLCIRESYQVDIPKARLYTLMAASLAGDVTTAFAQVEPLKAMLRDTEKGNALIAAGRLVKPDLAKIRSQKGVSELISALSQRISEYEQNLPGIRRIIRRHAVIVPFAPPKIIIRALGKIQVIITDHVITSSEWQVQTARDLFFLLLSHPEGLTKEQIGEIFWPDSSEDELRLRFKNTMYRLRHAAGKDVILFQGESLYLFNRQMDYEYDVETFLKELGLAEQASTREQKETHYQNAVKSYQGDFLPDVEDTWAVIEREHLRQEYIDVLLRLASIKMEERSYENALEYCQQIFQVDPCQEDAHRIAMRVYAAMGNRALVIRQYEQCKQALMDEVDAPPSSQTQTLYKTLIQ